jgi:hypothetical protein
VSDLRTRPTDDDVEAFLAAVPDGRRRRDAQAVCHLMADVTGEPPRLWGSSMVGFGSYHYRYASGHEGDSFVVGFAPRRTALVLYLAQQFDGREELLGRLGKHSTGKACVYVKHLEDVDTAVLTELVRASARHTTGEGRA